VIRGIDASSDCIVWPADEWVTITQQVTIGTWASKLDDSARTSNVRIWMQRGSGRPVLVIDYDRNLRGGEKPFMKYGKIWLLPYMTDKDPLEDHPEARCRARHDAHRLADVVDSTAWNGASGALTRARLESPSDATMLKIRVDVGKAPLPFELLFLTALRSICDYSSL
jgi:hypothetical protein